ncbi:hypothetical protein [Accumulibacter sp.]|uniref:hypothetical protein n=1 Tax=Accumulibacter sp. TaxID=2053492 RepID=UPI0025FABBD7|nr:hypothetical protein [Accumulibacter sp.]MCM8595131.1 hypothetical protein [Accumulibacter sp.]MCM8625517.1 hypothetical protein [Accumulibacter sp.]MDS4049277.1 hypothetical protein [Accumulibacter sp.]
MERHCETLAELIGDLFFVWLLYWVLAGVGVVLWAVASALIWLAIFGAHLAAAVAVGLWRLGRRYFCGRRAET